MTFKNISFAERSLIILNTIFHQSYSVVTVYLFWTIFYYQRLDSVSAWHWILSTLAYVPLMGEAIILFSGDNVWSKNMERSTKYWIHGVILIVSAVLATVGIALMINSKGTSPHFKSTHGWTGFVSWIFVLISQFLGLAAANAQAFSSLLRPVYLKFLHNFFGQLGYVFGIVSLCYGMETRGFTRVTSTEARTATYCLLALTTTWSLLAAFKSCYSQLKTILF